MSQGGQNLTYVQAISAEDRKEIDKIRAEIEDISALELDESGLGYDDVAALAWNISGLAHQLIRLARSRTPPETWQS